MKKFKWVTRICALAGMALLTVGAQAAIQDATILIDRAINSPTLTVKFSGATVALVELRVNGVSIGTRSMNNLRTGETNFNLDLAALQDGDNEIEVRLFDKAGKMVGSQKSLIATDDATQAAVFLRAPKMGATVQGPVEIKIGFGRTVRNPYVSFFIDNQFKSMTNVQPFSYIWDTSRESNGWHEVEAWVVDDDSDTLKTRKLRVFVNNPGGRTLRNIPAAKPEPAKPLDLTTAGNPNKSTMGGTEAGLKTSSGTTGELHRPTGAKAPATSGLTSPNALNAPTGRMTGTKAAPIDSAIATGAKSLTPTGTRTADTPPSVGTVASKAQVKTPPAAVINNVRAATTLIPVTKGKKLPNGPISVLVADKFVQFDVQPRVENGVPLTPFRHLIEHKGGEVKWDNGAKSVSAQAAGRQILIQIGDAIAKINGLPIQMEIAAFLENNRTIVPLSFIRESLDVEVDYDKATGHVLITNSEKK